MIKKLESLQIQDNCMIETKLLQTIREFCIKRGKEYNRPDVCQLQEMSAEILLYPFAGQVEATEEEKKFYEFISQYPDVRKYVLDYMESWEKGLKTKNSPTKKKKGLFSFLKKEKNNEIEYSKYADDTFFNDLIIMRKDLTGDLNILDSASYFIMAYKFETEHRSKDEMLQVSPLYGLVKENISYMDIFNYCKTNNMELKEKTFTTESDAMIIGDQELETPTNSFFSMDPTEEEQVEESSDPMATPILDKYAFDMTKGASEGKFDPVVGRSEELDELMRILCCRKKNNALLLGDPGVGKTAIIEALAQRIADNTVPKYLLGKRIMSLNLNNLVAGTKYRGQFEERLKKIIDEVIKHPEVIIFIDEFHTIIGTGSSEGGGDAANVLKPYLARGEFQCIGSTTEDEYRKHVEKDGALKRRFQNVRIYAPTLDEVKKILGNIKEKYEDYHGVKYSDEIIESIVGMTNRYVTDRNFPDKAIDLLDLAGSITKLENSDNKEFVEQIQRLEEEIQNLKDKKAEAIRSTNFEQAAEIRDIERDKQKELDTLRSSVLPSTPDVYHDVTELNVIKAISRISGVPLEKIGTSDLAKLKSMKETLEKIVIGQPEAIVEVTKALQRNSLGLRDPKKPIASILMVGPTGSGKTYICKTLAKEFFGNEDSLIKFDMSEYGEKHEITKLIGASASYVGYGDTPLLEQVRRKPYSVVLFDEIEKADKAIYQLFLSILDEGYVTLANGTKVDFKNCVIVFTGNVGTKDLILKGASMGFGGLETAEDKKRKTESIVKKAIEKTFAPEFINRLTKTVVFNELSTENLMSICELEMNTLISRLLDGGYKLTVDKAVKELIVSKCDLKYGARDLQRNIVKYVEDEVCNELLNITDTSLKKVRVSLAKKGEEKIKVKFS